MSVGVAPSGDHGNRGRGQSEPIVEPARGPESARLIEPARIEDATTRAVARLVSLQDDRGAWEGEMVWNTMLLAQAILVHRIVRPRADRLFENETRDRMVRYFRRFQTPDGGWGMHPESGPYVFFTTLSYVALRVLGLGPEHEMLRRAREWLERAPGGVLGIPSWGKLWLALLGIIPYEAINPVVPEMFLLPYAAPLHPGRLYCHTRYIYVGVAYLYGRRFAAELGALRAELRSELYGERADAIDVARHRHLVAPSDLHVAPTRALRAAYDLLRGAERLASVAPGANAVRERALGRCLQHIEYELRATRHLGLSPVSALLGCVALFASNREHPDIEPTLRALEAWRWEDDEQGIRYVGARSTSWDTALAMQALLETTEGGSSAVGGGKGAGARRHAGGCGDPAVSRALSRGYAFLRRAQMAEELEGGDREFREPILGGWCFSEGDHRWPVSDCTAEALVALMEVDKRSDIEVGAGAPAAMTAPDQAAVLQPGERMDDIGLERALNFILRRQNADGGFGTYEPRRGGSFLEGLNPSEMYASCMTELSYIECTASCVVALVRLRDRAAGLNGPGSAAGLQDPGRAAGWRARTSGPIKRAVRFLRELQRSDGSWEGFWGVCFTYATFHAVEALCAAGAEPKDPAVAHAAAFLCSHQRPDGAWGEHWSACPEKRWIDHPAGQPVMTSWALLALLRARPAEDPTIQRGISWLLETQREDGSWPEGAVNGVFFGSAMLDYRYYREYFPLWALARYRSCAPTVTRQYATQS